MKCPRCGHEMTLDNHRRIEMLMCYDCGYIEGRNTGADLPEKILSNFERLQTLDFNETVAFISKGLHIDENELTLWLERSSAVPTL